MTLHTTSIVRSSQRLIARHASFAMGTRFELVLASGDARLAQHAAEEAIEEIQLWHRRLNWFAPDSVVSRINRAPAGTPVRIDEETFTLLESCDAMHERTGGLFDITVAPWMRHWGFRDTAGDSSGLRAGDAPAWGMEHVILDRRTGAVTLEREGMGIDLGAAGKGHALDCALTILRAAGIESAFLHGGTSSIVGMGATDDYAGWPVAIRDPLSGQPGLVIMLVDEALGVSAPHGRCSSVQGKTLGHIIDPRTGAPTDGALLGAVVAPRAFEADVLSTALVVANDVNFMPRSSSTTMILAASDSDHAAIRASGPSHEASSSAWNIQGPARVTWSSPLESTQSQRPCLEPA